MSVIIVIRLRRLEGYIYYRTDQIKDITTALMRRLSGLPRRMLHMSGRELLRSLMRNLAMMASLLTSNRGNREGCLSVKISKNIANCKTVWYVWPVSSTLQVILLSKVTKLLFR
jgi:hypothetical protein